MRLHIESIAYGGDGVAHSPDGRAVFVPGSCPGDVVEVEIVSEHARYLRARIENVIEPSPERVDPPCPYFGDCGGCQWQHVSAGAQLEAKTAAVRDAVTRIGGIVDPDVRPCVASMRAYGYRNKVELLASHDEAGRLTLGFARAHSTDIVPIAECLLLPKRAQALPKALQGALRYVSGSADLGITRVTIRVAEHTRALQVAVWTHPGPFPRQAAAKTIADATGADSVVRVLVKGDDTPRKISNVEVLRGKPVWNERLGGQRMIASAPSFFQVNTLAAEELAAAVVEAAACDGTDRVLDAYAGVGTFTLPLADHAGEIVAIESSRYALADLERNLESAGVYAEVHPGDAARIIGEVGPVDVVVIDPPRAGLGRPALDAVLASGPRRIVYVSCDPATLARDASAFVAADYSLIYAQPVDLFPQTYHVETVALFQRA